MAGVNPDLSMDGESETVGSGVHTGSESVDMKLDKRTNRSIYFILVCLLFVDDWEPYKLYWSQGRPQMWTRLQCFVKTSIDSHTVYICSRHYHQIMNVKTSPTTSIIYIIVSIILHLWSWIQLASSIVIFKVNELFSEQATVPALGKRGHKLWSVSCCFSLAQNRTPASFTVVKTIALLLLF